MKPKVKTIPISDIKIQDRVRKDFDQEAIDTLARSIDENGLLHYPVINGDMELIAGERRIRACKQLGWEEITVSIREEIDPLQHKIIELQENVARANLTWQEEVKAKHQIHALQKVRESDWTMADTAELLGRSEGDVVQDINLAKAMLDNKNLEKNKNKTDAYKELKKEKENALRAELASRLRDMDYGGEYLVCRDCLEVLPEMEKGSVDLIVTDPPWGTQVETSETIDPEYDDSEDLMKEVVSRAYRLFYPILREGGHGYVFFGIQFMDWHIDQLVDAGFEVDQIPGIWGKESPGGMYSPGRESNQFESYLHFWKGNPDTLKGKPGNAKYVDRVSPGDKIHTAEKPVELWTSLIEPATEPGDLVVDPFAGSGSSLRAALKSGRQAFGCELDEVIHQKAMEKLEDTLVEMEMSV